MYYPKVLDGDTQPWILITALIAFFTFRTDAFINKRDYMLIILSLLSILSYAFRSPFGFDLLRHTYTYLSFLVFWIVCQREKGEYFSLAVKWTVILWFLVGLYQYLSIKMGYQIEPSGRYLEGRMGPPSLTAEASYYGSLSVLQVMYLLSEKNRKNGIYILFATISVLMSGSLLAMLLLLFPLRPLLAKIRIKNFFLLFLIVVGIIYLASSAGLTSRLDDLTSRGISFSSIFADASLNLRGGHIYFTMFENLITSLLLVGDIDFMSQYNEFAHESGLFIETGSNYILPAIGEMIYGSGIFAIMLLVIFLKRAQESCSTNDEKVEKVFFIISCMLNPISISNIFLIMYVQRKIV
jgi:hypothetical protein